jgi:hypothetical protein
MADFGQATFKGTEVVITCGEKMSCCQREQAKAKTEEYQREIAGGDLPPGPLQIADSVEELERTKKTAQERAGNRLKKKMDGKSKQEKQDIAKAHGASDCFSEQMADGAKYQMDHRVDAKWGGAADMDDFTPLDPKVNNFFGQVTQKVGDAMLRAGTDEISNVVLVCPPPCSPPGTPGDYSTGSRVTSGPLPAPAVVSGRD